MIEIEIQKGTVLGLVFAVFGAAVAAYGVGGTLAFVKAMDGGRWWIAPVAAFVAALTAGWLGWEVGHWFTRP